MFFDDSFGQIITGQDFDTALIRYLEICEERADMRSMMNAETIQYNCNCFKKQMERFIEFGEDKAIVVNNADWLLDLKYIELLRDIGASFSVNNMLRAE